MESVNSQQFLSAMRESFSQGLSVRLNVTGTSMRPFLKENRDAVLLQKYCGGAKKGEILLFMRPTGRLVLHRVVSCDGRGVFFRGDNQSFTEGPVPQEMILARCVCRDRKGALTLENGAKWRMYKTLSHFPKTTKAAARLLGIFRKKEK